MEITVALIIMAVTLIAGEISKLIGISKKWIPLQNLIIAVISSIICIIFKIQNMSILETILTCIFASMSAGGMVDIKDVMKDKEEK